MSYVASLENSKRLYELSGWDDEQYHTWREHLPTGACKLVITVVQAQDNFIFRNSPETPRFKAENKFYPAYDAGYLLMKLQLHIANLSVIVEQRGNVGDGFKPCYKWQAWDGEAIFTTSDTPENALCLLAIQLFRRGILVKESKAE